MNNNDFGKGWERFLSAVSRFNLKKFFNEHKEFLTSFLLPLFSIIVAYSSVRSSYNAQKLLSQTQLQLKVYETTAKDKQNVYTNFSEKIYVTTEACLNYQYSSQKDNTLNSKEIFDNLYQAYFRLEPYLNKESINQVPVKLSELKLTCITKGTHGSISTKSSEIKKFVTDDIFQ